MNQEIAWNIYNSSKYTIEEAQAQGLTRHEYVEALMHSSIRYNGHAGVTDWLARIVMSRWHQENK